MLTDWWQILVAVAGSAFASSGFWAFLMNRDDRKDAHTRLLLGMAHSKIVEKGERFIERGYITKEEYDDFLTYLYEPYQNFGGNGLAHKIKTHVDTLPIRRDHMDETKFPK